MKEIWSFLIIKEILKLFSYISVLSVLWALIFYSWKPWGARIWGKFSLILNSYLESQVLSDRKYSVGRCNYLKNTRRNSTFRANSHHREIRNNYSTKGLCSKSRISADLPTEILPPFKILSDSVHDIFKERFRFCHFCATVTIYL
jgi:hypothetical protein